MKIAFALLLFGGASMVSANDWGISSPWNEPTVLPPEVKPFELPTLHGDAPHFNTPVPALLPAPKIDPDTIFESVLHCYPEKSKFKIDIDIVAGMRANMDEYDNDDWPDISEHYIGIVGKMPLYSTTEQSRERQWEYQRRTATASAVAAFTKALASRNYSYRTMGLYLALEARSQARVSKGVANVDEQITLLEKVATAHRDVLTHEATLVEQRLALVAMCEEDQSQTINTYLQKIAVLPQRTAQAVNK
ncbi:hypothetical protein A3712_20735 [Vibrio sp. HI00D65]|uniref:hypothetical protein n=1 Tax=Vibrio sp. HI00D65 TaxID=1822216 RepID=UPI0007B7DDBD|nr:hypothetical protein [Vibrio sp. HI00D65]KZX63851.1 hypothetical protein A3712_20735 [Vibrio sp. HI00D65]